MTQSFLPKGLVFKEWKEHRLWMAIAAVLLLWQPVASWLRVVFSGNGAGTSHLLFWKVLVPTLYGVNLIPNSAGYPTSYVLQGFPYASVLSALSAMGLMIALVTVERNRGALWFTLAGPVSRGDQLRTKIFITTAIVLGTLLVKVMLLLGTDLYVSGMVPYTMILRWGLVNAMFDIGFMAIGLACASAVMVGMAAGLWALLITGMPWALARTILPVVPNPGVPEATASNVMFAESVMHFVQGLSPWHYAGTALNIGTSDGAPNGFPVSIGTNGGSLVVMAVWFVIWTLLWGWLGYLAYQRAPLERSSHFFLFPFLWVPALWVVTALVSYMIVNGILESTGLGSVPPFGMLFFFTKLWVPMSIVLNLLLYAWVRRPIRDKQPV